MLSSLRENLLSSLRPLAQRIRHLPVLERCNWLWNAVRAPYSALFNGGGKVKVVMGGVEVQIPTEFAAFNWETYEPETFLHAANWIRENPDGLVLDLGCATGAFSAAALFASETSKVVAFDSDLASLVATRRFCENATGGRLQVVYGFVADKNSAEGLNLAEAVRRTDGLLRETPLSGDPGTTRYVNISTTEDKDIPCWTLDALLSESQPGAVLIKCDVEGAEMLVLQGAREFISSHRPTLLLSVHPEMLSEYGYSREDVGQFLCEFGYTVDVISIDHEEHWWCRHQPSDVALVPSSVGSLAEPVTSKATAST